ncbi:MAG: LacI family transcriptional regulator [Planctomycetota bacterium]|nr:LacI family transcriptional regulator [Planctomycetota bacterium]
MPTLTEIAAATGLSTSTISRVLRGHFDVAETTRRQVEQALAEHGYRAGNGPRRGRPAKADRLASIAIVFNDRQRIRRSPFFAPLFDQTLDLLPRCGARVQALEWPRAMERMPAELERSDGALALDASHEQVARMLQRMPVVTMDCARPGLHADAVLADYRQCAFDALRILIGKGHRRFALLSAAREGQESFEMQIYDGARRALDLAGIEPGPDWVAGNVGSPEGGYALARQVLARPAAERPTALFGSDHAMLGALRAAHDLGLKVPKDVAVLGVDGIELGEFSVPRLSTIKVDKEAMVRTAAERVMWRLSHPHSPVCRIVLDCPYIERDSA